MLFLIFSYHKNAAVNSLIHTHAYIFMNICEISVDQIVHILINTSKLPSKSSSTIYSSTKKKWIFLYIYINTQIIKPEILANVLGGTLTFYLICISLISEMRHLFHTGYVYLLKMNNFSIGCALYFIFIGTNSASITLTAAILIKINFSQSSFQLYSSVSIGGSFT